MQFVICDSKLLHWPSTRTHLDGNLSQVNYDSREQPENFPVINVELHSDRNASSLPANHTVLAGVL